MVMGSALLVPASVFQFNGQHEITREVPSVPSTQSFAQPTPALTSLSSRELPSKCDKISHQSGAPSMSVAFGKKAKEGFYIREGHQTVQMNSQIYPLGETCVITRNNTNSDTFNRSIYDCQVPKSSGLSKYLVVLDILFRELSSSRLQLSYKHSQELHGNFLSLTLMPSSVQNSSVCV